MYNRYIPQDSFSWVPTDRETSHPPRPTGRERRGVMLPPFLSGEGLGGLLSRKEGEGALDRALRALHLEDLDGGDILLLLIVLYLFAEGDDLDLVIALGLVLIMGFGEDQKE